MPEQPADNPASMMKRSFEQKEPVSLTSDRLKWDRLGDLYAVIVTLEHLEIVWARGCCTDDELNLTFFHFIVFFSLFCDNV